MLFVCMGNICRSPTAEGVFRHYVTVAGLEEQFEIDSAGTHAYHVGEPPDKRAQQAALQRGFLGTRVGRMTGVVGDGSGRVDMNLVFQAGGGNHVPEHALGRGRAADVAHADKKNRDSGLVAHNIVWLSNSVSG